MFRKRVKHTKRYQEIVNAFLKNGFGHFLFRIGLVNQTIPGTDRHPERNPNLADMGIRLRETLQDLSLIHI